MCLSVSFTAVTEPGTCIARQHDLCSMEVYVQYETKEWSVHIQTQLWSLAALMKLLEG